MMKMMMIVVLIQLLLAGESVWISFAAAVAAAVTVGNLGTETCTSCARFCI